MADINAQIGTMHEFNDPTSQSFTHGRNGGQWFDLSTRRKPERHVFIYSVSQREFIVSQPPLIPNLIIRPCPKGERYVLTARIPDPLQQVEASVDNGDLRCISNAGVSVAQSICNPDNLLVCRADIAQAFRADEMIRIQDSSPSYISGAGTNLNIQGVFWSLDKPPSEAEIAAAEKRREKYYRSLIENARVLELSDPRALHDQLNPDYHLAADFFGLETNWHRQFQIKAECPNCGEPIKAGLAYHVNAAKGICIIDAARAKKAGVAAEKTS